MILSLLIHNLALIEDLSVSFMPGMHVLTGETGAGKSIVVDAVNLVLGGRSDRDLIRTGTDRTWVEAIFDTEHCPTAEEALASHGIEVEDHTVTLYREISRTGRSICRVCGLVMPLAVLKEVSSYLMDMHGQHDNRFLMDPSCHLAFLDGSGGNAHQQLLEQTRTTCQTFMQTHRAYARLVKENNQKTTRLEWLNAAVDELEKARIRPGEEESLIEERNQFRHAERISRAIGDACSAISGDELEGSAIERVRQAAESLAALQELGEPYTTLAERCGSISIDLQELGYDLNALSSSDALDPARAEQVEQRLELLRRLKYKYKADTLAALKEQYQSFAAERERYASMDDDIREKATEDRRALHAYRQASRKLTEARHELAKQFEQNITEQLRDLGMEKAVFHIAFAPPPEKPGLPRQNGDDSVEFMLSPNPGEPPKPLARTASGGELSRIMLALKTLEAEHAGVGCMVFDEIDTGISGRMAQVVAEKMADIASSRQVICVTHLPQIACMADHEFLVCKQVEDGRTNTHVVLLDEDGRTNEIARMLSGAGGVNESARRHASEMLEEAAEYRSHRAKTP